MHALFLVGIFGLVAIASCWALAIVLYRVGSPGSMARRLSLLLLIEGVVLITAGFPDFVFGLDEAFYDAHPTFGLASALIHHAADVGLIVLYLPFLAAALGTWMTAPFGRRRFLLPAYAIGAVLAVSTVVEYTLLGSMFTTMLLYLLVVLVFLFATVASAHAWWVAEPGVQRARAGLFAAAFTVRDICWGLSYGLFFLLLSWDGAEEAIPGLFLFIKGIYAAGTLFAVPMIAYGILRGHLFDIDLRIRWALKQSTVASLVIATVFLVSEFASAFFSEELGPVAGLFAAAVLVMFLTPLQQFAERVAASAMPNTENTPEYVAFRKMQVYENALIEALDEGDISDRERMLLEKLHLSLDITPMDAATIERGVRERLGRPEPRPGSG